MKARRRGDDGPNGPELPVPSAPPTVAVSEDLRDFSRYVVDDRAKKAAPKRGRGLRTTKDKRIQERSR